MTCEGFKEEYPYTDCIAYEKNHKTISAQEKGKKFIINNISKKVFIKVRIDNCIFRTSNNRKCDYLFINCNDDILYLVELKGAHLEHAIKQLLQTIDEFKDKKFYNNSAVVNAYVIMSKARTPALNLTDEIKLRKKLKSKNGIFSRKVGSLKIEV
ncbi:MAG: hypothetical protein HQL61_02080 [Magnetococcales bacterium]|nr:hypothetical protein [Nitrospirota bacterium]